MTLLYNSVDVVIHVILKLLASHFNRFVLISVTFSVELLMQTLFN